MKNLRLIERIKSVLSVRLQITVAAACWLTLISSVSGDDDLGAKNANDAKIGKEIAEYLTGMPDVSFEYSVVLAGFKEPLECLCILYDDKFYSKMVRRREDGDVDKYSIAVFDGLQFSQYSGTSEHVDISTSYDKIKGFFTGHWQYIPMVNPYFHLVDISEISVDKKRGFNLLSEFLPKLETWSFKGDGRFEISASEDRVLQVQFGGAGYPKAIVVPWSDSEEFKWRVEKEAKLGSMSIPSVIVMESNNPKSIFNYKIVLDENSVRALTDENESEVNELLKLPDVIANTIFDLDSGVFLKNK